MEGFNWSEARRAVQLFWFIVTTAACLVLSWRGMLFESLTNMVGWVICSLNWILGDPRPEVGNFSTVSWPIEEEGVYGLAEESDASGVETGVPVSNEG